MKRYLKSFTIDAVLVVFFYAGVIEKNQYAENVFWLFFWGYTLLARVGVLLLCNESNIESVMKKRIPNHVWKNRYDFVYDVCFTLALAAFGYVLMAVFYYIVSYFFRGAFKKVDREIKERLENL
ncbi:hypothetical protein [Pseudoalteromonas sp. Of7M-16]|uniref:hypothetical protein n=1 Tax=Pseudoalteromonas sp. Of7M-16 TaxID=2917756 RepID=UPI001EF547B1|nr:hypothetical protein [Pseudoalteromonas sp. Of7M-16]MCG7551604.1 hypothetical protein [Pseudoalteromonas sp. Of7M-16]